MNHKRINRPLLALRKKWKLSTGELSKLLGTKASSPVSRLERGQRAPTVSMLIGCEFVFGVEGEELFPELYARTREAVLHRAARFSIQLEGKTDRASARKRELLSHIVRRASEHGRA